MNKSWRRWLLGGLGLLAAGAADPVQAQTFHRTRPGELNGIPWHDYQWGSRSRSAMALASGTLLERPANLATRRLLDALATAALPAATSATPVVSDLAGRVGALAPGQVEDLPPPLELIGPAPSRPAMTPTPGAPAAINLTAEIRAALAQLPPQNRIRLFQLDRARLTVDHCTVSEIALQLHRDGSWVLSLRADQNMLPEEDPATLDDTYRPRLHLRRNEFHVRLRCHGFYQADQVLLAAGRPVMADLHPVKFMVQRQEPRHVRIACCDPRVAQFYDLIDRVEVEFYYR